MKELASIIPSKRTASVLIAIYIIAFVVGLAGLLLLPRGEVTLRKISFGMTYFFGLPVVLSAALLLLRKVGIWNGK